MPAVGVALAAAWTAISTAVAAITWAQVGTWLLSQVISWGLSKLLAPKQNRSGERQADTLQMSLGENPREAVFGQIATGGQLVDCGNFDSGTGDARKNRAEWLCIKLADHEIQSLEGFYVNDDYYPFVADGDVAAFYLSGFGPGLKVFFRAGTQTQTPPSYIVSNTGGKWTNPKTMLGCAHVFVVYFDNKDRTIFPGGRPRFSWVVKGAKLYDPRKDSTVSGGSGAHRWGTPSTYEWSENAYLIRYNWVRGIYNGTQLMVGRGLTEQEAPADRAIARANICDEAVTLKAGGTEPRYRAGGIVKSSDTSIDVEEWLAAAMAGLIVDRDGVVDIDPGAAQSAVYSISDADFIGGREIQYSPHLNENQRLNTVVGRWIDPSQRYADVSTSPRKNASDITADGRPYDVTIDLPFVLSGTQAQRIAEIRRRQGRLERVFQIPLGPKFIGIETGDWVTLQSDRYLGGSTITGVVTAAALGEDWQVNVAIREINSNVYAWTAASDEQTKGTVLAASTAAPGAIVVDTFAAVASTLTTTAGVDPAIYCTWLSFEDGAVSGIEFQVRKNGDTKLTTTLVEDTTSLQAFVTAGVGAQGSFDIRARGVSRVPGRVATWTAWTTVTTGGSGYGNELIVVSGQNIITKANWALGGYFSSASFVEAGVANGVSGWGVELVRATGNVPEADSQARVWKQNTDYTISFTAFLTAGSSATLTTDLWSGTVQPAGAKNHTVTATPTRFEWTFQSANAAMLTGCVARFYNVVTNSTTIRVTDIMVEEANKASKYAPAPGDSDNALVRITGPNRIPFSRFEQGLIGWDVFDTFGLTKTITFGETSGKKWMKVAASWTASSQYIAIGTMYPSGLFQMVPSDRVYAQVSCEATGISVGGVQLQLGRYKSDNSNATGGPQTGPYEAGNKTFGFTTGFFSDLPSDCTKGGIFVYIANAAGGAGAFTFTVFEPAVTSVSPGAIALPGYVPGPNAGDGADVTKFNNAGGLTDGARQLQSDGSYRTLVQGLQQFLTVDGSTGTFVPAFPSTPRMRALPGGKTIDPALATTQVRESTFVVSPTGFTVAHKIKNLVGTVTGQTQSTWTTVTANIRYECDKPTSGDAWNNQYSITFSPLIRVAKGMFNSDIPYPGGFDYDGYATYTAYTNDGSGWVARGSIDVAATSFYSGWSGAPAYQNITPGTQTLTFTAPAIGQHAGREFALECTYTQYPTSNIQTMGSVTYGTAGAPTTVAATTANEKIVVEAFLGADL